MSPDGKRAVSKSGKQLDLLNLKTGAVRIIKGISANMRCAWSPDGRWVACVRN